MRVKSSSKPKRIACTVASIAAVVVAGGALWLLTDERPEVTASPRKPSVEIALANRTLCASGFPVCFCEHQTASARGTAPYVLALTNGASKAEAIVAVRNCGARVIGPLPPNALLVETSIFALGKLSQDARFAAASEWLPDDKIDARLKPLLASDAPTLDVTVVALAAADVEGLIELTVQKGGCRVEGCLNGKSSVTLTLPRAFVAELAKRGDVRWLEPFERPKLLNDRAVMPSAMNVQPIWERHGLTGAGQLVTTSDSGIDTGNLATMHADLRDRIAGMGVVDGCYAYDSCGHGTHTAGSIVGDGTMSSGQIRGTAYGAKLWVWFCGLVGDGVATPLRVDQLFRPENAVDACIHSASWGSDVKGAYTSSCHDIDEYIWEHPDFLPVFSAGNAGENGAQTVGSPASAKNVLCVGSTQSPRSGMPSTIASSSSRGPCADGRIKPDVCSPGVYIVSARSFASVQELTVYSANTNYIYMSGTSMATPLTAGAATLVRQWLVERRGFTNAVPTAALVKAVLTGGAKDVSTPNSTFGWGRVDLGVSLYPSNRAVRLVDRVPYLDQIDTVACEVTLTNVAPFDVQLVWIDYPATAGATKTLVNDLDLVVSNKTTGATWCGNGIDGGDHTNTVECVRIASAQPGDYVILVRGADVTYESAQGGAAAVYLRGAFEGVSETTASAPEIAEASPASNQVRIRVGEKDDFSVQMATEGPMTYVWTIDGTNVAGSAESSFSWTTTFQDRGEHIVRVTVTDAQGLSASHAWQVLVWREIAVDATTGNDETATGAADRPYATLAVAISSAAVGDVLRVGSGVYDGGLWVSTPHLRIESVAGPASTLIDGHGVRRCFYAVNSDGCVLSGFTLTNGWDSSYGAGAFGGTLTNCTIVDCHVSNYESYGGGAMRSTLVNCRILNCSAYYCGGGLYACVANGCLLKGNEAYYAAGASVSELVHCTVLGNIANSWAAGVDYECFCRNSIVWDNFLCTGETANWEACSPYRTTFSFSCTTPTGYDDQGGNVNEEPRWFNAMAGDFRLTVGSPCVGSAKDGLNMGVWQGAAVAVSDVYVDAATGSDSNDGLSFLTAKRTIQAAVGCAGYGATIYATPGVYTGEVATSSAKLDIVAVAGPELTVIRGDGTSRCYVGDANPATTLCGFTLDGGVSTTDYGGGVFCGTLSNCVVRNCFAKLGGGGAYGATLTDCVIAGCWTDGQGGGAGWSALANCTLRGNQARGMRNERSQYAGGGVDVQCVSVNTVLWGNFGPKGGTDNWELYAEKELDTSSFPPRPQIRAPEFLRCCTTPLSSTGAFCIEADPLFASSAADDPRLYEISPCIAAGKDGANIGAYHGTGVVKALPAIDVKTASGEEVSNAVASVGYVDPSVAAGIGTNGETYAAFQAWSTNGLKSTSVVFSPRAYDSFQVREIVATPMLLGAGNETSVELAALEPSSDGTCSTTLRLVDGSDPIPLCSVKAAFARHTRVGVAPDALAPVDVNSVETELVDDGRAVKLTITPPTTSRYFMWFGIQ